MYIFDLLTAILWLSFWVYWLVSARGKKKVLKRSDYKQGSKSILLVRYKFIIFVIIVVSLSENKHFHIHQFFSNFYILSVGLVLCAFGLALAVWARIHLGRNWNVEPSIQENHELITSGPYKIVRHPIYSGFLLAFIGSIILGNIVWLIIFVAMSAIFIMRIKAEEGFMIELFADRYKEYKKHTWALIPFVW